MSQQVVIGADHAGFSLKQELLPWLESLGCQVTDVGAFIYDPVDDYPDFTAEVARRVASGEADRGVVICGSGVGSSVAANKFPGVRAGLCHDTYSAHQGVEHDDVNVLCIGARVIGIEVAMEVIRAFLGARFSEEERHVRRLSKVLRIEETHLGK